MKEITRLHEPFPDTARQADAAMLGIFVFIGTEIMLFGGVFLAIAWLRLEHPQEVVAASRQMHWWLAGGNTAVLLTSSAAVALAAEKAKTGARRTTMTLLAIAALLGLAFLGLKVLEYSWEYGEGLLPVAGSGSRLADPTDRMFMGVYLIATSLHAVHLSIGILLQIGLVAGLAIRRLELPQRALIVMVIGIYWHFVDVVWIFLYPLLYLAR
ncbi:MAG TPA: cytochrome c oxidase subunit 3 [Ensifer sp.]|nr:cytochrome c oxidase subunit 3 [Ensifer sp.]